MWTIDAAHISSASSQLIRRNPPLPRACWYFARHSGVSWMLAHALTVSPRYSSLAERYMSMRTPRAYGYFTRIGEYRYQE